MKLWYELAGRHFLAALLTAGMLTGAAPAFAQPPAAPKSGAVRSTSFDWNLDGQYGEIAVLSSLLDASRVVSDGLRLPEVFTGGLPVVLGTGHGQWRYNQQTKTLSVRTLHTSQSLDGGGSLWVVTVITRPSGGRLEGFALFSRYNSLADFLAGLSPVNELKAGASEVLMES
jgi:hypothetical protein